MLRAPLPSVPTSQKAEPVGDSTEQAVEAAGPGRERLPVFTPCPQAWRGAGPSHLRKAPSFPGNTPSFLLTVLTKPGRHPAEPRQLPGGSGISWVRWKQGARDSWGLRGDRVRTESGARMVVAATCRKATQEYTAGMQEGREGAWLPLRAETAGKFHRGTCGPFGCLSLSCGNPSPGTDNS